MPHRPLSVAFEIRQSKPFRSVGQEAVLTLLRTAAVVQARGNTLLTDSGISVSQYNVLRILRGAGSEGLGTSAIRDRMLDLNPGVTRLIDRLAAAGLVTRERHPGDRRAVRCRITKAGLALLEELDPIVDGADRDLMTQLSPAEQRTLIRLLDLVRASAAGPAAHP
ncbi:MAG TPA: MarR family transcriptional regulator [Gemmatimonadales bacterium]|nr:MarR family transcriptional regulator [Gemmatimonadales bacterium]